MAVTYYGKRGRGSTRKMCVVHGKPQAQVSKGPFLMELHRSHLFSPETDVTTRVRYCESGKLSRDSLPMFVIVGW